MKLHTENQKQSDSKACKKKVQSKIKLKVFKIKLLPLLLLKLAQCSVSDLSLAHNFPQVCFLQQNERRK